MSTTVAEVEQPRTIRLTNGKTVTVKGNNAVASASIPTIDVGWLYSLDLEERKLVAEDIREASRNIGFSTVINHGIDPNLSEEVLQQAREFFALPLEEKMNVSADLMPDESCGYHPIEHYNINCSKRRDLHEAFNWNYDTSLDTAAPDPSLPSMNLWPPDTLPDFRPALCAYQSAMTTFARRLTRTFALALHLPETYFDPEIQVSEAGARILHYPAQTTSRNDQNGIGAHTDVEYFTIIHADSPGLEVLSKEGDWLRVTPVPGAFVVNIGDCFMRQTNDYFVSTVHRVINETGKERFFVPLFWGFDRRSRMETIPTCVVREGDGKGSKDEVMTAGEYYAWRTRVQRMEWKM